MCVIQINSDPNLQRGIRRGVALVRVERKVGCSILGRDRPESLTTFSDSAYGTAKRTATGVNVTGPQR